LQKRLYGILFNQEVKAFDDLSLRDKKRALNDRYLKMVQNGIITKNQYNVFVKVYNNHENNYKSYMQKNNFREKKVKIRPDWMDRYEKETEEHSKMKQLKEENSFKKMSEDEKNKQWQFINEILGK